MRSTFQSIKKRIFFQNDRSAAKPGHSKRKIEHPHLQREAHSQDFQNSASVGDVEASGGGLNGGAEVVSAKPKGYKIPWRKRRNRKTPYQANRAEGEIETAGDCVEGLESRDGNAMQDGKAKRFGFFRRSACSIYLSPIGDAQGSLERPKIKLSRPKSVDGLNKPRPTSSLSFFSRVRRSTRPSRMSEGAVPSLAESSQNDATASPGNCSSDASECLEYSNGDISSTTSSVKGTDETAKSMSIDSGENQGNHQLKATADAKDVDLDINMNDIGVNVTRLDNKAAYDKIALRPKRRPARNARGVQQQNVVRLKPQVNGFSRADTSTQHDDPTDESVRDTSPPRAKKARTPVHLPLQPPQESGNRDSGEGSSATPKRYSMLGKSPVGSGPGMVVPSLQDVKNFKLRKTHLEDNGKKQEGHQEHAKNGEKSKPVPIKAEKPELPKKVGVNKKPPKQDEKSVSSLFSWRNKSGDLKSPAQKSSVSSSIGKESSKENEEPPKAVFPELKLTKKAAPEKESKVSAAAKLRNAEAEKKDSPKIEGFKLQKRGKNHSENNSKVTLGVVTNVTEDKTKPVSEKSPVDVQSPNSKMNVELVMRDVKAIPEKTGAERPRDTVAKRESGGDEHKDEPKTKIVRPVENNSRNANKPLSPQSVAGDKELRCEDSKTKAFDTAKTATRLKADEAAKVKDAKSADNKASGLISPAVAEKPKFSNLLRAEDLGVNVAKSAKVQSEQTPKSPVKSAQSSSNRGPNGPNSVVVGTHQGKKETSPSSADADTKLYRAKSAEKKEDAKVVNSPSFPKAAETMQSHSSVRSEEEKSKTSALAKGSSPPSSASKPNRQSVVNGAEQKKKETLPFAVVKDTDANTRPNLRRVKSTEKEDVKIVTSPNSPKVGKTFQLLSSVRKEGEKSKTSPTTISPVEASVSAGPALDKKPGTQLSRAGLTSPDADVALNKTTVGPAPEANAARDKYGSQKSVSFDRNVSPPLEEKKGGKKTDDEVARRIRSFSARDADAKQPVEIYSRGNLKPVGDQFLQTKRGSVRISPASSTKTPRPRSVGSEPGLLSGLGKPVSVSITKPEKIQNEPPKATTPSGKPVPLKEKPASAPSTDVENTARVKTPSGKPPPLKEKPKVAEKVKSPFTSPLRTPNVKITGRSAAHDNSKSTDAATAEDSEKGKATLVSEQAKVSRQRTSSKPAEDEEDKSEPGIPDWVKMARRRSQKARSDDAGKTGKPIAQNSPSPTDASENEEGRPKTLPVVSNRRENSTSEDTPATTVASSTAKTGTAPVKSSPQTPSGRVQYSRTGPIPAVGVIPETKKTSPVTKQAASPGQPSWLAIAMQKQKNWAKEETV